MFNMNRLTLTRQTREVLAKTGFYISEENNSRTICFDIVARRDNLLIILKILTNVDSISKQNAYELSILSEMLMGTPLIIGQRSSQKMIEPGIVYFRYGVPMINYQTLYDFFAEGVPPLIFAAPGGFYVNINGELLQKIRQARRISLGSLADIAGVSRKAIQMYEKGMSTMVEVAIRLEDYLQLPLVKPINPFDFNPKIEHDQSVSGKFSDIEERIYTQLESLGYNVVPTKRCPFDALTKDKKALIITGISGKNSVIAEKARAIHDLSKITEHFSVIFIDKDLNKDNLEGTPVINIRELKRISDSDDVISLISERR